MEQKGFRANIAAAIAFLPLWIVQILRIINSIPQVCYFGELFAFPIILFVGKKNRASWVFLLIEIYLQSRGAILAIIASEYSTVFTCVIKIIISIVILAMLLLKQEFAQKLWMIPGVLYIFLLFSKVLLVRHMGVVELIITVPGAFAASAGYFFLGLWIVYPDGHPKMLARKMKTVAYTNEGEPEMKFCSHCGKEIMDAAVVCPHCGCPVGAVSNEPDIPSTGLNVLSLLIPLVGLILYLAYHDKAPNKARAIGKFALIGVGIGVALGIFNSILILSMF